MPSQSFQVFQRGAYFSVEVVPDALVVISLNTLYFYDSNKGACVYCLCSPEVGTYLSAVRGCVWGDVDDAGNLEFDWLEVQLESFRERGMYVSAESTAEVRCRSRCCSVLPRPVNSRSARRCISRGMSRPHREITFRNACVSCLFRRLPAGWAKLAPRSMCGTRSSHCASRTPSWATSTAYAHGPSNLCAPPRTNCIRLPSAPSALRCSPPTPLRSAAQQHMNIDHVSGRLMALRQAVRMLTRAPSFSSSRRATSTSPRTAPSSAWAAATTRPTACFPRSCRTLAACPGARLRTRPASRQ
jgi:hypothetical protein